MNAHILCLNGGSSSLKFAVYCIAASAEEELLSGAAEAIGTGAGRFWLSAGGRKVSDSPENLSNHAEAVRAMFAGLRSHGIPQVLAAGHRVVHGGPYFDQPQRVTPAVLERLKEVASFAPLHVPSQIALMEAVTIHYPELPQVACFDTAFHSRTPELARRFALPRNLWEQGVRRYGFHGLSYEYVVDKLGRELGSRAIIAHLGNGASMVALRDGTPVDTSMGLTPTGGFMMGTRTGDLDPGVLLYLLRQGRSTEDLARLLDYQSGLLGVSGATREMKELLELRASQAGAAQAVAMFCYQVKKFIGAYAAVLQGLDTLVFTGGIGEHAAEVRQEICGGLEYMGISLDPAANAQHSPVISKPGGTCSVRVVRTNEDLMIARHTHRLLSQKR